MIKQLPPKSHGHRLRIKPAVLTPPPPPPPPAPRVVLASFDEPSGTIEVIFDQFVTWDGSGHGTFQTSGGGGNWGMQVDPVTLRLYPDCGSMFDAGETWSWESPDGSVSPTPDPTQSGNVS